MADLKHGEILKELIHERKINKTELAEALGMSRTNLYQLFDSVKFGDKTIAKLCKYMNIDKIIFTEKKEGDPTIKKVPFYDVYVTGGAVSTFADNQNGGKLDPSFFITIPHFRDCDLAVRVSGDSMWNKYRNGDIIVCKRILNKELILFGEVYLVVTKHSDYRTVKYVEHCEDEKKLLLTSENKEERFKPIKINKTDILELYLVRGKVELT